ncbi:MAG: hypothetical protein ABJZ69_09695 [Hyphomicrobiales bacterium]
MVFADDAGLVSKPAHDLARVMAAMVTVFEAVSERKAKNMMLQTQRQAPQTSPLL